MKQDVAITYQGRSWGGCDGSERTRPEKIVPFIFLPQNMKPWKNKQSIFKQDEYNLKRKVFGVTTRDLYITK